jgi:hypothetical protein
LSDAAKLYGDDRIELRRRLCKSLAVSVSRLPYLAEFDCGRTLFGKSRALPLCLQRFVAIYGHCLSDVHSNDISANSWRAIMNQDIKGQPQQGDQNNKPGQQGQQPGQKPVQQTQQPSQKPGQDASKS